MVEMIQQKRNEISQSLGGRNLHFLLQQEMKNQNIKLGRDKFFDLMRANWLLVPKLRNFVRTTNSNHIFFKFPNLVLDKVPTGPEELWVSDITYIKLNGKHAYLALITDAYSKKIMGYKFATNMKASLTLGALEMALKNRKYPNKKLIHHSDRGFQYCWPIYTEFAQKNGLILSMTQQYDPYENALAERVNRTIKYDFGLNQIIPNKTIAQKMIKRAILVYNSKRPHESLKRRTPDSVHQTPNIPYRSYRKNKEIKYLDLN